MISVYLMSKWVRPRASGLCAERVLRTAPAPRIMAAVASDQCHLLTTPFRLPGVPAERPSASPAAPGSAVAAAAALALASQPAAAEPAAQPAAAEPAASRPSAAAPSPLSAALSAPTAACAAARAAACPAGPSWRCRAGLAHAERVRSRNQFRACGATSPCHGTRRPRWCRPSVRRRRIRRKGAAGIQQRDRQRVFRRRRLRCGLSAGCAPRCCAD